MELVKIRHNLHSKYCRARQLHYLVASEDFGLIFEQADPELKQNILTHVTAGNIRILRKFIKEELVKLTPFHKLSMAKLREMARRLLVVDYHRLRKALLVEEISCAINRIKESPTSIVNQSAEAGTI